MEDLRFLLEIQDEATDPTQTSSSSSATDTVGPYPSRHTTKDEAPTMPFTTGTTGTVSASFSSSEARPDSPRGGRQGGKERM